MKAIVRLKFSQGSGTFRIPTAPKWMTCTIDQTEAEGGNWSFQIIRQGQVDNNVMIGQIQFVSEQADYLLEPGTKFNVFGASQFKCEAEILKKID